MRKVIFAVLIAVMMVTPCFAQEVKPEGIFSIEGILWQALPMRVQISPFPYLAPMPNDLEFGFYGGTVYAHNLLDSFYIDCGGKISKQEEGQQNPFQRFCQRIPEMS